jgi:hypothetical protein
MRSVERPEGRATAEVIGRQPVTAEAQDDDDDNNNNNNNNNDKFNYKWAVTRWQWM